MANSVAYQEINNNFTTTGQTINNKQIPTIMSGGTKIPGVKPDFIGQFYFYIGEDHTPFLSVAYGLGITDWALLDMTDLPNTIVRDNVSNNFTETRQTIKNNQIVTVQYGNEPPKMAPDFLGQFYIHLKAADVPDLYVSDGYSSPLDWHLVTGGSTPFDPREYAKLKESNNFEQPQTMKTRPMVTAIVNSIDPSIKPEHSGQLYIKADGSPHIKMWVSVGTSSPNDWKPMDITLADTVALTNKSNNFTEMQMYKNSPIPTVFVSGQAPAVKPDYRGQLHFNYNDKKDKVEGWVAIDNKQVLDWVAIEGDMPSVAKLNVANNFHAPQYVDGQIMTTSQWSTEDPKTTPTYAGQIHSKLVWHTDTQHFTSVLFTAILDNKQLYWAKVIPPENYVRTDGEFNFDSTKQAIKGKQIISAYIFADGTHPTTEVPDFEGQLFISSILLDVGQYDTQIWIGHFTADRKGAWIPLVDSTLAFDKDITFGGNNTFKKSNTFEDRIQYLGTKTSGVQELIMGARVVDGHSIQSIKAARVGEVVILRNFSLTDPNSYTLSVNIALDPNDLNMWGEIYEQKHSVLDAAISPECYNETIMGSMAIYDEEDPTLFQQPDRVGQVTITKRNISQTQISYKLWMVLDINKKLIWQEIKTWIM